MDHTGAVCGGFPSSAQQGAVGNLWPAQQTVGAGGVPVWPGQTAAAAQNAPQPPPPPCWTGQPNTACWPGAQPASYPASYPASVQPQASYPASFPAQVPSQALSPAQTVAPGSTPAPSPSPGSAHPCQPCWLGAPQYQPQPQPLPLGPGPAPTPVPVPAPAPGAHTSSVPGWVPPTPPSWPYNPGQPGWPGQNPTLMPPHWPLPPTSGPLSVPYNLNLSRGVYDKMMITIMGHVRPDAKMFTVNFLRGNDIAFHINPRFNEGGKQVFVRNHKCGERWGAEERSLKSSFPFAPGSAFEMKILCTHEEFRVAVNNIALFEFRHRIRELNQIDRINILHDVVLTYVNVETLP